MTIYPIRRAARIQLLDFQGKKKPWLSKFKVIQASSKFNLVPYVFLINHSTFYITAILSLTHPLWFTTERKRLTMYGVSKYMKPKKQQEFVHNRDFWYIKALLANTFIILIFSFVLLSRGWYYNICICIVHLFLVDGMDKEVHMYILICMCSELIYFSVRSFFMPWNIN